MSFSLFDLAQPFLLALDPERAHALSIQTLLAGIHPRQSEPDPESLKVSAFGLDFPNPVGMAAGFDKNGEVTDALLAIGFGFTEAGTVTPRPQRGNPRPRVFRLAADRAVINRLGFNNDGHAAMRARLEKRRASGIVGVNIGANKDATDRVADYCAGITALAGVADYFTVNISSPNTPGLRDLQARDALDDLLKKVLAARETAAETAPRRPVLLKLAPDLGTDGLKDAVEVALKRGIDGMIVSNTTISRPATLREKATAREAGGLSGRPLFDLSTRCLAQVYRQSGGAVPLVGVGGIDSGETAYAKIRAGATLVQLYTGMIFGGAGLITSIKGDLARFLARDGHTCVADAVGTDTDRWLEKGTGTA